MSNLSRRVLKSKELRVTKTNKCYHTWGSSDDRYEICLASSRKDIVTPDGYLNIPVFHSQCNNSQHPCKGNTHHTVCYHSIGAIFRSFERSKDASHVSFYETYHAAVNGLNLGGYIAKIVNNNGKGHIWCAVRKNGEKRQEMKFKVLDNLAVNLMRGNDNEGID